ncbi:MAG: ankyrin repeat domain-containing protein [Candidatus Competibacterales bacterium]
MLRSLVLVWSSIGFGANALADGLTVPTPLVGTEASAAPTEGTPRWSRAIFEDDVETLSGLLATVGDVDFATPRGKTALMAAAKADDLALVEALLTAGADINLFNHNGGTALMYAAGFGALALVERLLAAGADPNHRASNGWTALMMAAAKDRPRVVTALLRSGGDPNIADVYGWTPLMRAAYEGQASAVAALLADARIDLKAVNDKEQTALHLACIHGDVAIVQALVAKGASAEEVDALGYTPRGIAKAQGFDAVVAVLEGS